MIGTLKDWYDLPGKTICVIQPDSYDHWALTNPRWNIFYGEEVLELIGDLTDLSEEQVMSGYVDGMVSIINQTIADAYDGERTKLEESLVLRNDGVPVEVQYKQPQHGYTVEQPDIVFFDSMDLMSHWTCQTRDNNCTQNK